MPMKKNQGRGRPMLEGEGGVRLMLHVTPDLLEAINERTKEAKLKDSKKKRADVLRTALRAYFFPPGKRRVSDPKREPAKE
jgi:hypothetical protein